MEAIRLKAVPVDGKLSISVHEELHNQELETNIVMQPKPVTEDDDLVELYKRRMEIVGKAPYPDFPITMYDIYNQ